MLFKSKQRINAQTFHWSSLARRAIKHPKYFLLKYGDEVRTNDERRRLNLWPKSGRNQIYESEALAASISAETRRMIAFVAGNYFRNTIHHYLLVNSREINRSIMV